MYRSGPRLDTTPAAPTSIVAASRTHSPMSTMDDSYAVSFVLNELG